MARALPSPLVSLDFETTGLAPESGDRITEVGLVRILDGRIVARYSSLMNCAVCIPRSITAYTGITQRMVDEAPTPLQVMSRVLEFIHGCSVVSHNALFDQMFLEAECRRLGLAAPAEPFLCSMRIARQVYPEVRSPSLAQLARVLSLPATGAAHRAPADAEMTAQLALQMMRDLEHREPAVADFGSLLSRLRDWSNAEPAAAF